jgi:hypothetical protein
MLSLITAISLIRQSFDALLLIQPMPGADTRRSSSGKDRSISDAVAKARSRSAQHVEGQSVAEPLERRRLVKFVVTLRDQIRDFERVGIETERSGLVASWWGHKSASPRFW